MPLLSTKQSRVLTGVLLAQAALFYGLSRGEAVPVSPPLSSVPHQFGAWRMLQEGRVEPEVQEVLKADDILTRTYARPGSPAANLFIAFFKSQRTGQAPHSPKNCLPGNGWVWAVNDTIPIQIAGRPQANEVNRYIDQKGE